MSGSEAEGAVTVTAVTKEAPMKNPTVDWVIQGQMSTRTEIENHFEFCVKQLPIIPIKKLGLTSIHVSKHIIVVYFITVESSTRKTSTRLWKYFAIKLKR